jgi:hypothetical protein
VISKLRHDSELYLPFLGEQKGRGKPRKYGDRLTMDKLTKGVIKSVGNFVEYRYLN